MKIILVYCLLVNLTSSSEGARLDETPSTNEFPGLDLRCNYSLGFSLESDAALGKYKEVREHP